MNSKKEEIYRHILAITTDTLRDGTINEIGYDALNISLDLSMDRSNTSRLLNQLHRDGRLIKIMGRPTLYAARRPLEEFVSDGFIPSSIPKGRDLSEYVKAEKPINAAPLHSDFEEYIYNDRSSMYGPIQQAQAAILYPPRGLNTLIIGSPSVGKVDFASAMFSFGKTSGTISEHRKMHFFDCLNFDMSKSVSVTKKIFGYYQDTTYYKGVLDAARNSVLIMENIDALNPDAFSMLRSAVIQSEYTPIGAPSTHRPIDLKCLIIGVSEKTNVLENNEIRRMFPIQIELPELSKKTIDEMLVLTLKYLQRESKTINKTIRVSKGVLSCFVMSEYTGNFAHLSSEIKQACAKAYRKSIGSDSFFVDVDLVDISISVLENIHDINKRIDELNDLLILFENEYLFFSPIQDNKELALLYDLNQNINRYDTASINRLDDQLVDACIRDIDYVTNIQLNTIRAVLLKDIYQELYPVLENTSLNLNENLLYGLMLHISSIIKQIKQGNRALYDKHNAYRIANDRDYTIAYAIKEIIEENYTIQFPDFEVDYIATYLYLSSQWVENKYIQLLIISENNENAKNFATYLNSLNHKSKAYALSINPANTPLDTIQTITETLSDIDKGKGVIIATDSKFITENGTLLAKNAATEYSTFTDISLQSLVSLMQKIDNLDVSVSSFRHYQTETPTTESHLEHPESHSNDLLNEIADKLLSESLIFLNPQKVCNALYSVLQNVLKDLSVSYSDDILVKFVFHCSFMVERCIRKDPINDQNSRSIIQANENIYYILEKNFSVLNEIFSINIPNSELGMVIEIFKPYVNASTSTK